MKDYFPLIEGLSLEYRVKSSDGDGGFRFEVVCAACEGGVRRAHCRRVSLAGQGTTDLTVTQDERGVFVGRALELPLPPEPGRRWDRPPNSYRIAAADAVKTVPAGTFRDCLRVAYRVAGGDAGSGEKFYAPGVGLIYDMCAGESGSFELLLVRAALPGDKI